MNPVVLVLATQRFTQLVTEDEIARPIRERVDRWAKGAEDFTLPERIATLIECSACMSIWSGAGILLVSRFRVGRFLIGVLAVSQASLIFAEGLRRLER